MSGWFDTLANFNPAGFNLRNQGLAAENEQRQAATQQSQAATQGQQLQNQQLQQQQQDQQIWTKAMQGAMKPDGTVDTDLTTKNAITGGMSAQGVNAMLQAKTTLAKNYAEIYNQQQQGKGHAHDNEVKMNDDMGQLYQGWDGIADPTQKQAAIQQLQQGLYRIDPTRPVPTAQEIMAPGFIQKKYADLGYEKAMLEQAKQQAGIDKDAALTKKTNQDASKEQRAQAVQELSGVVDPNTARLTRKDTRNGRRRIRR